MKNVGIIATTYLDLVANLEQEKGALPPGHLIARKVTRKTRYSQRINGRDYGITQKPDVISQLARKGYIDALIEEIKSYLNTPLKDMPLLAPLTHQQLVHSLPPALQGLPDTYFYLSTLDAWLSQPTNTNPNYKDKLIYPTNNGLLVRSKEEVILSNTFTAHNIPHKFEVPYQLGNQTLYPDFTILNPYTGKQFILEHHGAFHLKNYGEISHKKIVSYTTNNLQLNDTLIITYSDDIKKLERLQEIIKNIIFKI